MARAPVVPRRARVLSVAAGAVLAGAAACSGPAASEPVADAAPEGEVIVLAAASLNEVMPAVEKMLEKENPGLTVTTSLGPSSALAQQVVAGAPADVIVTASAATMQTVVDAEEISGDPVLVARNSLEIATPPGNPAGVATLEDLAEPGLKLALCAPQAPCGAAAAELLERAGVGTTPATFGRDVTATLTLVRLGEVDAALVYRTDVIGAGDAVTGVEVPRADEVLTDYPAAVLAASRNPEAARTVVDLLASPAGQGVLREAGFTAP